MACAFLIQEVNGGGQRLGGSFAQEVVEFAAILFGGSTDLGLALTGVEAGGLELQAFDLFGGGDVDIIVGGLSVLEPMVQKGGDFDPPAFLFGLDLIFIAHGYVARSFGGDAIVFHLAFVAGFCRFGPGLEETDGPKVFVEAEFFFFGHGCVARGRIRKVARGG